MTRKSKKYQLLVITLLLCILQVAGIDVYAQSTVTPMKRDTTITQREAPKARARRHREPAVQDSLKKDSIRIVPSKELVPLVGRQYTNSRQSGCSQQERIKKD